MNTTQHMHLASKDQEISKLARRGPKGIPEGTSLCFAAAKVIAIFTVVLGHWFTGTILWIPVTFGLFVFAFSSAYFTGKLYGVDLDKKRFWRRKLERLGLRFWLIMLFLSLLLIAQGRPVLHWHSAVHFFGLSGFLNWVGMKSQSSLGGGLWFFTLLLLFYVSYPFIAQLSRSKRNGMILTIGATALTIVLQDQVHVGHELWLTAFGFVLGVVYGLHEIKCRPYHAALVIAGGCLFLVAMNLPSVNVKYFNSLLITMISVTICLWLTSLDIRPGPLLKSAARLDKYLLEIFLIHTYLFIHPSGNRHADFVASLLLIMACAVALNWLQNRIAARVFQQPRLKEPLQIAAEAAPH